jgi:hypothetical protein
VESTLHARRDVSHHAYILIKGCRRDKGRRPLIEASSPSTVSMLHVSAYGSSTYRRSCILQQRHQVLHAESSRMILESMRIRPICEVTYTHTNAVVLHRQPI